MLARDLLDPADDLDGPRALELVEDDVEQRGAALGRGGSAAVAALVQQPLDALARGGGDIRASVDHLGDGRHRDASGVGDLGDRDPSLTVSLVAGHGGTLPTPFDE